MGWFEGFDFMLDVVSPAYEGFVSRVESAGRGVDRGVRATIEVVGGAADKTAETVMEDVISPAFDNLASGIESVGRGVDRGVRATIEVVGGAADKAFETLKENPTAVIATAIAATASLSISPALGLSRISISALLGNTIVPTVERYALAQTILLHGSANEIQLIAKRLFDTYLRANVEPIPGSVLFCDLGVVLKSFSVEHTGIYAGNGEIVHLDGSGAIEIVTPRQFLGRLNGVNCGSEIYVACDGEFPVGKASDSSFALSLRRGSGNYSLFSDNCHRFTSTCITRQIDNFDVTFTQLQETVFRKLGANNWRVWRF